MEDRDSAKMKNQRAGPRAFGELGAGRPSPLGGLGILRGRFAISSGLFDGGNDLLRGVKDIVGGCQFEAAFGQSLFPRLDVVAFQANNERDADLQ